MTRTAPASRSRSLLGLSALIAAAAALLELAWLAAFSWAVSSGALEGWVNRRPEKVVVGFDSVRSVWPGLIAIEGLTVRGRTPRLDWEVRADRARGQLAVGALARRRAIFRAVDARGVTLRTRYRLADRPPTPGVPVDIDPIAPIDPIGSPATGPGERPGAAAEAPGSRARPRWTFEIRRLRVDDVREVHLDATRFTGDARGEGGFVIRTADSTAEVFASRLEIASGEIAHRGEIVGRGLTGALEARVEPWNYRELRGRLLLPLATGRIALRGQLDDRALIDELLSRAPWATIEPAVTPIEADLRFRRGRLLGGSRLDSPAVPRRMSFLDYRIEGRAGLEIAVDEVRFGPPVIRWSALFSDFELRLPDDGRPLLTGIGLALTGRAVNPVLSELAERTALALELGEARLPDLSRFSGWLPPSAQLEIAGGSARVAGELSVRLSDLEPSGMLEVEVEAAKLRWSGLDLEGRVHLKLPVQGGALETRRLAVRGATLRLSEFSAPALGAEGESRAKGWWANLYLPQAQVSLSPPVELEGTFDARLRDTVPFVGLFELRRDLPRWAERALSVENVEVEGAFRGRPGQFELVDVESPIFGGVLRARARFAGDQRHGRLLLSWRRLAVGVGFDGDRRQIKLARARAWFDERDDGR